MADRFTNSFAILPIGSSEQSVDQKRENTVTAIVVSSPYA